MKLWRVLLLGLLLVVGCSPEKPTFKAIDLTGAEYAQDFHLKDHHGQMRSMADFKGQVVVVFFGYTQCPDFCPTTLSEWVQVKKALGDKGNRLQAVFITVDPERDTAELLKAYMANFDPTFIALRPSPEQLPQVARDFKIYFKKAEGPSPTSYTMDHTAASYTFDTQGRVRLYNRYGSGAPALAEDVKILLKGA